MSYDKYYPSDEYYSNNDYHPDDIINIINGLNDFCLGCNELDMKQFDNLFIYIDNFCYDCIKTFGRLAVTPYVNFALCIEYPCFLARTSVLLIALKNTPIEPYLPKNIPLKHTLISIEDIINNTDKIIALCSKLKRNASTLRIKNNNHQACIIC
jgi:hypothetical protein